MIAAVVLALAFGLARVGGVVCAPEGPRQGNHKAARRALDPVIDRTLVATDTAAGRARLIGEAAEVLDVIDGDTIVVALLGTRVHVRYIGIDTPETGGGGYRGREPWADEATAANAALLGAGEAVWLELDSERWDRYDRLLAYVYVAPLAGAAQAPPERLAFDEMVNAALVRDGWAEAKRYGDNDRYHERLDRLEDAARSAGRGIWTDSD